MTDVSFPGGPYGRLKLGELLVRQGKLTRAQVSHILDVQAATDRPFGDLAERLFGIDAQAIEDAWVEQFVVEAEPQDVSQALCEQRWLSMIERRQAWQFRMVPMRHECDHLLIAADRRGLLKALNLSAHLFPITPCLVLAEERSLQGLLMRYFPVPLHLAEFAFSR